MDIIERILEEQLRHIDDNYGVKPEYLYLGEQEYTEFKRTFIDLPLVSCERDPDEDTSDYSGTMYAGLKVVRVLADNHLRVG